MEPAVSEKDLEGLLGDLLELYGYDFSGYSQASILRRIRRLMSLDHFVQFDDLRFRIRTDKDYVARFVEEITVNVTEMFRDPSFYLYLRNHIIPEFANRQHIRIWHAGCSTGEEAYSMAILLQEAGLLDRSLIYATDINPQVVEMARRGIFSLAMMKQYSVNYIQAGGREDFSKYYTAQYSKVKLDESLRRKMIFATHNLVSDSSFNEFQLIFCRNVLIYFKKKLQDKVLYTLDKSLATGGYLTLGGKETIRFSPIRSRYEQSDQERIWKKIKA